MFNRTQAVCRYAEFETAIQLFAKQCYVLKVGQEDTLGLVVGVAYIVAGQAALAGQFANARHAVSRSNSGPPAIAEGQLNLWDYPGKARA